MFLLLSTRAVSNYFSPYIKSKILFFTERLKEYKTQGQRFKEKTSDERHLR